MSLNSYRAKIERLTRQKQTLEANIAKENKQIFQLQAHIFSISHSIKVNRRSNIHKSKLRRINSKQKIVDRRQKRILRLESRLADKMLALGRNLKILNRIETRQQRRS
jgi:predicted RNase H-like nuclease (RuvC/YqgF family)